MTNSLKWFLFIAFLLPNICAADQGTSGTYILQGGSYTFQAEFTEDALTVIEPNKRSIYTLVKPNVYEFINTNNRNIRYWLKVIDAKTLEASKPDSDGEPSYMKLVEVKIPNEPQNLNKNWQIVADKYMALTNTDPDNVQSWSLCAQTAMSYALQSEQAGKDMAQQNKEFLKVLLDDPSTSPCPEVIPF